MLISNLKFKITMKECTELKTRILKFIAFLEINPYNFEKKVGISNGTIRHLGRTLSKNTEEKLKNAYPELNITWLLTGEGEMLKQSVDNRWSNISITQRDNNTNNINQEREALITHLRDEVEYLREQNKQLMELLKK